MKLFSYPSRLLTIHEFERSIGLNDNDLACMSAKRKSKKAPRTNAPRITNMTQSAAPEAGIPPSERSIPTSASESIKDVEANLDGTQDLRDETHDEILTPHISNTSVGAAISKKETSVRTTATNDPNYEVDYAEGDDQTNPKNWPTWYKIITLAVVSWCTFV